MDRRALFVVYVALGGAILAGQQGNQDDYNHIPHPPYPPSGPPAASMNWADRHAPPKGPVARIVYKNFSVGAGTQPQLREEVVREFDELAQEITELGSGFSAESGSVPVANYQSKIVMAYQGGRMVSRDTMNSYNQQPFKPETSDRWKYDSTGHLIDFQQELGSRVDLHYTNFKYDAAGRLISRENYGRDGRLAGRLVHRYAEDGRSIKTLLYFGARQEVWGSEALTLDEKGQIVELETASWDYQMKRLKRTAHVTFRYDERGRCVVQDTDQSNGNHVTGYVPPKPGKVVMTYDDVNRTQETSSLEGEQHVAFKIRLNEKGQVASFGVKLAPLGEFQTVEPECKYDAYGNWTECKEFLVENGARVWSHWYTRTITYR